MAERTVLVTGATGLLGREVVSAFKLLHSGWAVKGTGYSRADGVDILKVDLESAEDVAKTLDETRYVLLQLHLLASYSRPDNIYANNSSERETDPKWWFIVWVETPSTQSDCFADVFILLRCGPAVP